MVAWTPQLNRLTNSYDNDSNLPRQYQHHGTNEYTKQTIIYIKRNKMIDDVPHGGLFLWLKN